MARAKRKKAKNGRLHREPIVRRVAELLDSGAPTKWRWTSPTHRGLRAAMCLQGIAWDAANKRAEEIVTLARHRIGLSIYPSWIEARGDLQEVQYFFCAFCGGALEPDDAGRPYCSESCGHALRARRYMAAKRGDDSIERRTAHVLQCNGAEPLPPTGRVRQCHHCDKPFPTVKTRTRFCSRPCARAGRRYYSECMVCAATFWSHGVKSAWCSRECRLEARRRKRRLPRQEKPCAHCGTMFKPRDFSRALYCSKRCNGAANFRKRQALEEADGRIQQVS